MIAKNKQWNPWLRRIKRKIFLGSRQEEKRFTVPTPILDNSQEHTLEELKLMRVPVVVDLMDDNWTPNQRPQPKLEILSNGTTR